MESLGVPRADGGPVETDPRAIWRRFAEHYHLFRGTPSRIWHDWVYSEVFGLTERLTRRHRRPLLRRHGRQAGTGRLPPPRPVRALQHRGHHHHREPAGPAGPPPGHPRVRLEGPRPDRLPPGPGARSRLRGIPRQSGPAGRDHRRGRPDLGRLSGGPAEPPRVLRRHGRHLHRPRPPHRLHRRPRRRPRRRPCSRRSWRAGSSRPTPSCSAARC